MDARRDREDEKRGGSLRLKVRIKREERLTRNRTYHSDANGIKLITRIAHTFHAGALELLVLTLSRRIE